MLPRFPSRRVLPEKLARLRIVDGSVVTRGRGHGTEFDALREYVIGDDVRSIDWRASARAHDVVVRTWRPERDRRVFCVLDTGRTSAVLIGDAPRLDASIDAALLLSQLQEVFAQLSPIEADILRKRMGIGEEPELTLKEIGERYSLSRERIRQLQEQALTKLRGEFRRRNLL